MQAGELLNRKMAEGLGSSFNQVHSETPTGAIT